MNQRDTTLQKLKPQTPLKSFTETDQHESGHSSWHPALESLIQDQPCSQRMHIKLGVLRSGVLRPITIVDHRQQYLPIRSPIPIFLKPSFYHVELFIVIIQSRFLDIYSRPEFNFWKWIPLLSDLGDFFNLRGLFFFLYIHSLGLGQHINALRMEKWFNIDSDIFPMHRDSSGIDSELSFEHQMSVERNLHRIRNANGVMWTWRCVCALWVCMSAQSPGERARSVYESGLYTDRRSNIPKRLSADSDR